MLSIRNITKKFNDTTILDNISLQVPQGTVAFLLGASGVGKSTLLRILNNLEKPDAGTILLDGAILDLAQVNRNHTVGMLFQQFNLFEHLTALENITLALTNVKNMSQKNAEHRALELLKEYDVLKKAHNYPAQLSGGQKQRLALARMLALEPKIICLDEPTSALDPLLTSHVSHVITKLAQKGLMVLVATHDVTLLEKLDCTIYLMKHGKIIDSAKSTDYHKNTSAFPKIHGFIKGALSQ